MRGSGLGSAAGESFRRCRHRERVVMQQVRFGAWRSEGIRRRFRMGGVNRRIRVLLAHFVVAFGSGAALLAGVAFTRPVFDGASLPVRGLRAQSAALSIRPPWVTSPVQSALGSRQFLVDRAAFVADLLRTGRVNRGRAWDIAEIAVREAYRRRVPPALVLGVMLTEDGGFKSAARSSMGAIGLMQVHAPAWHELVRVFGSNIRSDSTNLKYGIYILGLLASTSRNAGDIEASWRDALLRYNGCITGSNTSDCRAYPDVVRQNVVRGARYSCAGLNFESCVAAPLWLAMRDGRS